MEIVTETPAEVVLWPKLSVAIAVREWLPFGVVVVSHAIEYGEPTGEPILEPSS